MTTTKSECKTGCECEPCQRREAFMDRMMHFRRERFVMRFSKEQKRHPKGSSEGGQFAPQGGGSSSGGSDSSKYGTAGWNKGDTEKAVERTSSKSFENYGDAERWAMQNGFPAKNIVNLAHPRATPEWRIEDGKGGYVGEDTKPPEKEERHKPAAKSSGKARELLGPSGKPIPGSSIETVKPGESGFGPSPGHQEPVDRAKTMLENEGGGAARRDIEKAIGILSGESADQYSDPMWTASHLLKQASFNSSSRENGKALWQLGQRITEESKRKKESAKPKREDNPLRDYEEASDEFRAASSAYREAARKYRAQEIGDEEFLAARKRSDEAEKKMDAAEMRVQAAEAEQEEQKKKPKSKDAQGQGQLFSRWRAV